MLRLNVDMKPNADSRSIGDLAASFGLEPHVLRHWEAMGLLSPARTSGRRVYGDADAYRVSAILRGKAAGLSLDQLRNLITATDPAQRIEALRAHQQELQRKAAAIEQALSMIGSVLACTHEDFTECPNFRAAVAHS